MTVKFKYIDPTRKDIPIPSYATQGDAGMDIRANWSREWLESFYKKQNINWVSPDEDTVLIAPGEQVAIPTNLAIEIPYGYEAQFRMRSGLSFKHGIMLTTGVGTIDCGYRGEILGLLYNSSDDVFSLKRGDRIGQLVINKVQLCEIVECDHLTDSVRGKKGFGSTGVS